MPIRVIAVAFDTDSDVLGDRKIQEFCDEIKSNLESVYDAEFFVQDVTNHSLIITKDEHGN